MHHNPQIDSIFTRGTNGAGALLIHGFTGTADSMRPVATALAAKGFTVSVPLLAGHGTTPQNCAKTNWHDWYQSAHKAMIELEQQCSKIFICGFSMGSLLALKLAIDYPQIPQALACLATPLHLHKGPERLLPLVKYSPLRYLWKFQKKLDVDIKDESAKENFWNYDTMPISCILSIADLQKKVRKDLPSIHTPTILIHSRHDSTAPFESVNQITSTIGSAITETVTLENSYHVITLDFDKDIVANKVTEFFTRFL